MPLSISDLPASLRTSISNGTVIPAHPLALTADRALDVRRQRALTRYYMDAGAGGLAVGVHTTQFAIREAGLYAEVLRLASETVRNWEGQRPKNSPPMAMIAGLVGWTEQAKREADIAVDLGYHAGLLSLGAWRGASEDDIIEHCRAISERIPLFGFYLQPAVGGVPLGDGFWHRFAEIENVIGIKIAPFNRYATLDVIRGVALARAEDRIALYTGNDDHIVLDLVTPFIVDRDGEKVVLRIRGGLLGHWSVWTKCAVGLFHRCRSAAAQDLVPSDLMAEDSKVTACNAAIFDVAHNFHGVIAGCHEVLRRQGLLAGTWCLDPREGLSPGQAEAIAVVARSFPELTDDEFVSSNLERWLE
ncbi:MAG: dihydrodipicolinate synthase family protein [Rhodomicrobium sp.]